MFIADEIEHILFEVFIGDSVNGTDNSVIELIVTELGEIEKHNPCVKVRVFFMVVITCFLDGCEVVVRDIIVPYGRYVLEYDSVRIEEQDDVFRREHFR